MTAGRTGPLKWITLGPVADATTKPILEAIIEMTNDSVYGLVLFTVLLRSLGQLSVYKSMKLEIEELKRRENYLDKKWDRKFSTKTYRNGPGLLLM